jgi:amino acid adenylation domain-containing protein
MLNLPRPGDRGSGRSALCRQRLDWSMPNMLAPTPRSLAALLVVLAEKYGLDAEVVCTTATGTWTMRPPTVMGQVPLGALADAVTLATRARLSQRPVLVACHPASSTRPPAVSDADLAIMLHPDPSGAVLEAWHDPAAFDAATTMAVLGHLARLLETLSCRPTRKVSEVDVVTDSERALLLEAWNGTVPSYPPVTLHGLFAEQCRSTPAAAALIDGGGTWSLTYQQLDSDSNRIAQQVRPFLSEAGEPVALLGDRGPALFTALLGILKAGGAFVYLDPGLPGARLEVIRRLTAPRAVLRTAGMPDVTRGEADLVVEDLLAAVAAPACPLADIAGPETDAYVIFTSGSTGEPKGVLRPHRLHTSRIFLEQRIYAMGPEDRHLLKSPLSFREFFWPLATGGAAVVVPPGMDRDDRRLAQLIHDRRITTVSFVPSMLRRVASQPSFAGSGALRHVFTGGEPLPVELERQVRALGVAVHNTYTLTEADYVCHRQGPLAGPPGLGSRTVVGRPLDMRVYLCDEAGHLVPPGVVGEIYTGGPGLARGYIGRPDLTAARFVENRVDPDSPVRVLFRTGDLGRFRPDGQIEFAGRADTQVKVRGHRVEPEEVEAVLRGHPEVDDVAVTDVPDPDSGHVLLAHVVPGPEAPTADDLRRFVSGELPDFMVPAYFVIVPTLPALPSGKVDRAALAVRPGERPELETAYTEPAIGDERRVARIFASVLGLDRVGLDDDFFALGGDSLRLMVLRGAMESALGIELDLSAVLTNPTVRTLVSNLAGLQPAANLPGRGA